MIENGSFRTFTEKLGPFIERHCFARVRNFNSCFPWSNYIIRTSVKALKKMSFLEVVVSSSLMLCRSKNAEKKENPIFIDIYYMYIHVTTSIATMIKALRVLMEMMSCDFSSCRLSRVHFCRWYFRNIWICILYIFLTNDEGNFDMISIFSF